ncbi:glycoside hydrolase family 127 protein [Streptomyces hirsutus]
MIFGTSDSGVANPARSDGVTLLDEIWAGAPFGSRGALVTRVRATVADWVSAGLLGGADGDKVVRTARNASYAP